MLLAEPGSMYERHRGLEHHGLLEEGLRLLEVTLETGNLAHAMDRRRHGGARSGRVGA